MTYFLKNPYVRRSFYRLLPKSLKNQIPSGFDWYQDKDIPSRYFFIISNKLDLSEIKTTILESTVNILGKDVHSNITQEQYQKAWSLIYDIVEKNIDFRISNFFSIEHFGSNKITFKIFCEILNNFETEITLTSRKSIDYLEINKI